MAKKVRNRTLAVKTSPEVKLTYYMYAAQHNVHVVDIIERIAECLKAGGEMSIRDCLETKASLNQNGHQNRS
jgi:hypothetical protein